MPSVTAISNFSSGPESYNDGGILLDTLQYVEPVKYTATRVPNHILDTKIYTKFGRNEYVEAQPSVIHFAGFEVNKKRSIRMNIANVSVEVLRMHIIPPQTRFFDLHYTKRDRLVPGLAIECTVDFFPDEWRYYYDCIRINCEGDANLVIPIHAYPVMSVADFPTRVDFPMVPIGDKETRRYPLKCFVPVDFEFEIKIIQPHPAFLIQPLSGIVPGMGHVEVAVTFAPTEFQTAHMKIELLTSQFNSAPLICNFTGSSASGLLKEINQANYEPEFRELRCETPLDRVRSKRSAKKKPAYPEDLSRPKEIEYKGIKFSTDLNSPYAVGRVLNQQEGKLRMTDLKHAISQKSANAPSTRQMKEAMFEKAVRTDVYEERQNQLRWQVKIGSEPMTSKQKRSIASLREQALFDYKYVRLGEPKEEDEYRRTSVGKTMKRTRRDASDLGLADREFDSLSNNLWSRRHNKLYTFAQAVHKVIVRTRVNKRLAQLQPIVTKLKNGSAVKERTDLDEYLNLPTQTDLDAKSLLQTRAIRPYQFPTYAPSKHKDDMAPDALGIVGSTNVEVIVKQKTSYFDLKVPQTYTSHGYTYNDVHECSLDYVPPKLQRTLRVGAEEEKVLLPMTMADHDDLLDADEPRDFVETMSVIPDVTTHTPLVPPHNLFSQVEFPDLHVFNPCPGLQVFQPSQLYMESDIDFHLCPIPRYMCKDHATNIHSSTQRKYLDREDIIRGVMSWKKFPSQGITTLANLPSLTTVWVPRWNDPFCPELLPHTTPDLLTDLPESDLPCIQDAESDNCELTLTPEMVHAQFGLDETIELVTHDRPTVEQKETELEFFISNKMNKLGAKVQSTRLQYSNLFNNEKTIQK